MTQQSALVSFTYPIDTGGSPIVSYTVVASPGNITSIGSISPILVTGLSSGVSYSFIVTATNAAGTSLPSVRSPVIGVEIDPYYVNVSTLLHSHTIADIPNLQTTLDSKATVSNFNTLSSSIAGKTDVGHSHVTSDITGLTTFVQGLISSSGGGVTSVGVSTTPSRITTSGGPITSSGNISLDLATTGVTAGAYTNSNVTVDEYGRVTTASSSTINVSGLGLSGTTSGTTYSISSNATPNNTPNTIVGRDSNGSISVGSITGLTSAVAASRATATTGSGAYAWSAGLSQVLELTLTGNVSPITSTGTVAGTSYVLYIKQDATGSRTATWSGFKWASGVAPTLSTAGGAIDIFTFYYDGTAMNCVGTSKGVA